MLKYSKLVLFCLASMITFGHGTSWSQISPSNIIYGSVYSTFNNNHDSYISLGMRKYINSFTSYQFLNPEVPSTDPLSRLEWPWEQTYGVVKAGVKLKGIQVNFEGASTLLTYSGLLAQDSDWTDDSLPDQKTIFSDAHARPRGWTFDASFGFDLPLNEKIRWIIGYRAQQFRFTYTDLNQRQLYEPWDNGIEPGEIIQFTQDYKHYYCGGVIGSELYMGNFSALMEGTYLAVRFLGDIGYVTANNVDYHVLRSPGPRHTYEATDGLSWRLNMAADLRLNQRFVLGVAGEFMRITSVGSHRWTEPSVDETWDGARVWSDQKFIEINASINF